MGNLAAASVVGMKDGRGPHHIAIIMDGNGRWATERGYSRIVGHKRGQEIVREIVDECINLKVEYLTLYAFSTENWKRTPKEVHGLMRLFKHAIVSDKHFLMKKGVSVRFIGSHQGISKALLKDMLSLEDDTRTCKNLSLQIAFNYGGRQEIVDSFKRLIKKIEQNEDLTEDHIDEDLISSCLYTGGIPDPDLLIRTSGEKRLSNFLIWQSTYSELAFVDQYWPDFSREILREVVDSYLQRVRRFGG
jgi:undecaprenyl diphosphate synthase